MIPPLSHHAPVDGGQRSLLMRRNIWKLYQKCLAQDTRVPASSRRKTYQYDVIEASRRCFRQKCVSHVLRPDSALHRVACLGGMMLWERDEVAQRSRMFEDHGALPRHSVHSGKDLGSSIPS